MSSNLPTIENLHDIKNVLEQKMNESSDSDYSTDNYTSNSNSTSSSISNKKSKKCIKNNTDYKSKCNRFESKIRYMQLEMVNKDIEVTELKNKLNHSIKIDIIFTKIHFLFERLDNAYKILKERINLLNDNNYIKLKMITDLTTNKDSLRKVQEKYALYINNEVYSLIDTSDIYFKNAITALYDIKEKELTSLSNQIDVKINNTKFYNALWLYFFVLITVIFLQIIIIIGFYLFEYFN
jgi:hypothetical protein